MDEMANFGLKIASKKIWSLPLDLAVKFWLNFRDEFQAGRVVQLMHFFGQFWGKIPCWHSL
jgi:hypothetical protein